MFGDDLNRSCFSYVGGYGTKLTTAIV